jgi:hypothetical protein
MESHSIASAEPDRQCALAKIKHDLAQFELGPELQGNVRQHYGHLESLTATLKTLGVDDVNAEPSCLVHNHKGRK